LGTAVNLAGRLYFVTIKLVFRVSADFPSTLNFQASSPIVNLSIYPAVLIFRVKSGLLGLENHLVPDEDNLLAAIVHIRKIVDHTV
jgi:hypothetical protein